MTEPAAPTASASATPPAPSVDVSLPKPSYFWTRLYTWVVSAALLGLMYLAITRGQPAFAVTLGALLGLFAFLYIGGGRAVDIVQIVQSSGIIRAAQSASTAVTAAADAAGQVIARIAPQTPPIVAGGPPAGPIVTGGRNDLAS